ncbi:MAG: acyltransferase family protein [Cyanobium sp.]
MEAQPIPGDSKDPVSAFEAGGVNRTNYRPEIDGLRALAVIAVIVNHFSKDLLPSGYLGVDIFFVISGYVISRSLLGRPHQSFSEGLASFYARRIKRLVPALLFCVVLTSLAICLFNPAPGVSLQTGLTALLGASNIYLYSQSTDYFAPSTELNAFTHTWSLGVEEQFYLFFPFFLWLAGFWKANKTDIEALARKLALIIGVLAFVSLICFGCLYSSHFSAVYFLMPFRFWELGAGCLLALLTPAGRTHTHRKGAYKISNPALLIAMVGIFFIPYAESFITTIATIALTCLLIHKFRPGSVDYKIITSPLAVWIGLISYSLYLWHWSILCLSRWTIGIQAWTIPFQVLAMFAMSAISYYFIEKPLRFASWHPSRLGTIFIGLTASILGATFLIFLGIPFQGKLFVGKGGQRAASNQLASNLVNDKTINLVTVESQIKNCNVTPLLLGVNSRRLENPVDTAFIRSCLRSDSSQGISGRRLLLVGDSFAEKLAPHAFLIAKKLELNFGLIYGYGCTYLLKTSQITNPSFPDCRHLNEIMLRQTVIDSLRPGDIVLLRLHLTSKSYVRYPTGTTQPSPAAYDLAFKSLAKDITQKGAFLIVAGPNPNLSIQEMMALNPEWFNGWQRPEMIPPNNSQETIYYHQLDAHLQKASSHWDGAKYISLAPDLCTQGKGCNLNANGRFLYFDDHHLSPYGHDVIFTSLLEAIRSIQGPSTFDSENPRSSESLLKPQVAR